MSVGIPLSAPQAGSIPVAPSAERWAAMTPAERASFLEEAEAALNRQAELMPEGSPHIRAKFRLRGVLGDFFARMGRDVYLGSELPVHYPDERVFAPDLIAVHDVPDPGDKDARMAWVVASEGRGVDLALEIIHSGDRKKDFVDNVFFYAHLGIPEYFVYDRLHQTVQGWQLPTPEAGRYQPIRPRGGMLRSEVLNLDLGIISDKLRFFLAGAEVPETRDLLERANALVDELGRKAEDEARALVEERAAREAAERRAEEEARRADALEREIALLRARLGEG